MSLKGASSSVDKKLFIREWRTGRVERRGREGGWEGRGMGREEGKGEDGMGEDGMGEEGMGEEGMGEEGMGEEGMGEEEMGEEGRERRKKHAWKEWEHFKCMP